MCRRRARDVDLVDKGVIAEIASDIAAALDDAQGIQADQRTQRSLEIFGQVVVDRVHFQDHHLMLVEKLVEHIKGRDGRDIARAQNQRNLAAPPVCGGVIGRGSVVGQSIDGDARLHPDLGRDAGKEDTFAQILR